MESNAHATRSLHNHRSHIHSFDIFSLAVNHPPSVPSTFVIGNYLAILARSLSYSTIKNHLSSLIPFMIYSITASIYLKISGYFSLFVASNAHAVGSQQSSKLLITTKILSKLHSTIDFTSSFDLVFWTACLFAFITFFHKSNLFPSFTARFDPV